MLLASLALAGSAFGADNPLIDGMVRMMEGLGFVDRDRLPLGVPYLPSAGATNPFPSAVVPGPGAPTGGFPTTGLGLMPGNVTPNPLTGMPGGGLPAVPGAWPGGTWFNQSPGNAVAPPWTGGASAVPVPGLLDGIWETNKGGVVIIRADAARLYLARDRYQDYLIRYDDKHFWWRPRDGSKFERYRYEMREGRMVLADSKGNLLLLRRRR